MGSKISVRLVYNSKKTNITKELKNVLDFLINKYGMINNVQVSEDKEGKKWIQRVITNNGEISSYYEGLGKYFYGSIGMKVEVFNRAGINIVLRVEKAESYFGFLIDFNESEILSTSSIEELEMTTNEIISLIESLRTVSRFDYGFCDHEAEIEHLLNQELLEEVYSVVYLSHEISNNGKPKIIRSKWHIDGVTARLS